MNYSKIYVFAVGLFMSLAASAQTTSRAYIQPVAISAGDEVDVEVMLDNPTDVVIGMQCDVYLPEGITFSLDEDDEVEAAVSSRNSKHQISSELQPDGAYRFVLTNGNNRQFKNTSGCVLTVTVKASSSLASGVYILKLKNVSLSDTQSRDIPLANSYAFYTSGTVGDSNIAALNAQLSGLTDVNAVDLTGGTVNSTTAIATGNPNTLIYLADGSSVGNTNNVVVGGECANLVLTDGNAFGASTTFTATNASYARTMSTEWGTICLPYAVQSNENVAYYNITDLNAGVLTIEKYETLPANTPALVKKLSGDAIAANAENVAVGGALSDMTGDVTMIGSYANGVEIDNPNAYFIYYNKFYNSSVPFYIDAFHAYFTVTGSGAKPNVLAIGEDMATAINALTGESDVNVEAVYDVNGAQRSGLQTGLNIVKMSNGKTVKIRMK